jgi:hypothetical protein
VAANTGPRERNAYDCRTNGDDRPARRPAFPRVSCCSIQASTSPTTECRITSGIATTCTCSRFDPLGTNTLVSFSWTAQWTDGTVQTRTQDGASSLFSFTWTCGGPGSTDDGAARPLAVTLTVTDNTGGATTVSSGSGSQPPLFLRLFKC